MDTAVHNPPNVAPAASLIQALLTGGLPPVNFRDQAESLNLLIKKEYAHHRSGITKAQILSLTAPWIIPDLNADTFLERHAALLKQHPLPAQKFSEGFTSISAVDFAQFLTLSGPRYVQRYLDGKSSGYTSCTIISREVTKALNDSVFRPCAKQEGIAYHDFTLVLVEGQPYVLDFTIDQFVDYERIRESLARIDEPLTYYGVLVMPVDRMFFSFDKLGRLVDPAT